MSRSRSHPELNSDQSLFNFDKQQRTFKIPGIVSLRLLQLTHGANAGGADTERSEMFSALVVATPVDAIALRAAVTAYKMLRVRDFRREAEFLGIPDEIFGLRVKETEKQNRGFHMPTLVSDRHDALVDEARMTGAKTNISEISSVVIVSAVNDWPALTSLIWDYRAIKVGDFRPEAERVLPQTRAMPI